MTVGAASPLQEAAVVGLKFPQSYYDNLQELYTNKRNLFCDGLTRLGIRHTKPQGAYYVLVDISEFGWDDDTAFCEEMTRKIGVAAVPGSSFFREPVNNLIRLHFAKSEDMLNEVLNRLENLKSLKK